MTKKTTVRIRYTKNKERQRVYSEFYLAGMDKISFLYWNGHPIVSGSSELAQAFWCGFNARKVDWNKANPLARASYRAGQDVRMERNRG